MRNKVVTILVFLAIIFIMNGCYNGNVSSNKSNHYSEQDFESYEENEPEETGNIIDAGTIKKEGETVSTDLDIPKWDFATNNILKFRFKFEGQKKNYFFIAPESGTYRFAFEIDNVESNYDVKLCQENREELFSISSNNECNVELSKNEKYILKFSQVNGLPICNVTVSVPNPIMEVENNRISGSITYTGQEDEYLYKTSVLGVYGFKLDISNVEYSYKFQIMDSKKNVLSEDEYRNTKYNDYFIDADLDEEKTYTIKVCFDDELDEKIDYDIVIYQPNSPTEIGANTIEEEFVFGGQQNIYYYTPQKTATYNLVFNDGNEPMEYDISFCDENNHTQGPKNNHDWNVAFEVEAGVKYKITVIQKSDYGKYHFEIKEETEDV